MRLVNIRCCHVSETTLYCDELNFKTYSRAHISPEVVFVIRSGGDQPSLGSFGLTRRRLQEATVSVANRPGTVVRDRCAQHIVRIAQHTGKTPMEVTYAAGDVMPRS